MRETFKCPHCGHPQYCPCRACQARNPVDKPWIWIDGELIQCGGCGFIEHEAWWAEEEYKQVWEDTSG